MSLVTIKLIDKKTGKTTYKETLRNAVGSNFIYRFFRRIIANQEEEEFDAPVILRIATTGGDVIKDIYGVWYDIRTEPAGVTRRFIAFDSSEDEYTAGWLYLATDIGRIIFFRQQISETQKRSYNIFFVDWKIIVG